MPKVTQNRVYDADGSIVQLNDTADSVVGFLSKFNALRFVQASEPVIDAEGNVVFTEKTVKGKVKKIAVTKPAFNADGSPKMIARPRSGYTQYFNNDGFTNPISPEALTPQGIGKLLAKLYECAETMIQRGGAKGDAMKTILGGVDAYRAVASAEVAKAADNTAMEQALAVLTQASGGDVAAAQTKLADFLKNKGISQPAPTVAPVAEPSITVAEAVEAASEVEEQPQDAAPETVETEVAAETEHQAVDGSEQQTA